MKTSNAVALGLGAFLLWRFLQNRGASGGDGGFLPGGGGGDGGGATGASDIDIGYGGGGGVTGGNNLWYQPPNIRNLTIESMGGVRPAYEAIANLFPAFESEREFAPLSGWATKNIYGNDISPAVMLSNLVRSGIVARWAAYGEPIPQEALNQLQNQQSGYNFMIQQQTGIVNRYAVAHGISQEAAIRPALKAAGITYHAIGTTGGGGGKPARAITRVSPTSQTTAGGGSTIGYLPQD